MRKEKYIKVRGTIKNCVFLICLLILLYASANYTSSQYISTKQVSSTVKTAQFNIDVNNKKIGKEESFDLILLSADNTFENKIVPDSEGYFEITINPQGTQVSIEYNILFDLTKINSENRTIKLTKYSLDGGNTFVSMTTNNINGEINLKDTSTALSAEDAVNLRIYWEWKQDIVNPTFENTSIQVTSIITQKVPNGSESI